MSATDILTDINAVEEILQTNLFGNGYCHSGKFSLKDRQNKDLFLFIQFVGMYSAAKFIYDDICNRLIDIFDKYPDYSFVICGYSLGAGIAAILSILFKPIYPSVKCFGIAMPGSVLSKNLADATRHFIFSYVVNVDMITRASIRSLSHLRDRILDALSKTNRNKVQILTMTLAQTLSKRRQAFRSLNSQRPTLLDDPLISTVNDGNLLNTTAELVLTDRPTNEPRAHLILPGTIIHLFSTSRVRLFSNRMSYRAYMSTYDQFSQLIVHPRMWFDHFPASYANALSYVIENYDEILQDVN